MLLELTDDDLRQVALFHIGKRQKRQARFGGTGAKRREVGGTYLRGVAVLAGMARPRIVDRDIGAAKAGFQYSFILGAERLKFGRQQTHHLPLRNHHAHAIEKSDDPLASDLPGEMKRQHQAMQIGAIAADKPRIESGDDRLAVRRFPTFATISRHLRVQAQVLYNDVLKSLVARA